MCAGRQILDKQRIALPLTCLPFPSGAGVRAVQSFLAHRGGSPPTPDYGRLSVGNMDPAWLREGNLPPTYYVYGTEDPFYHQFQEQYQVVSDMGISTNRIVLNNWPHGFGADGGWVKDYASWLEQIFTS